MAAAQCASRTFKVARCPVAYPALAPPPPSPSTHALCSLPAAARWHPSTHARPTSSPSTESMFELADLWSERVDEKEYLTFLQTVLAAITKDIRDDEHMAAKEAKQGDEGSWLEFLPTEEIQLAFDTENRPTAATDEDQIVEAADVEEVVAAAKGVVQTGSATAQQGRKPTAATTAACASIASALTCSSAASS